MPVCKNVSDWYLNRGIIFAMHNIFSGCCCKYVFTLKLETWKVWKVFIGLRVVYINEMDGSFPQSSDQSQKPPSYS